MPRATRELIVRHPDRFLFGTDAFPPDGEVYAVHRRFFETADEHFPYDSDPDEVPSQGRWTISGLELPADVLERVYAANVKAPSRLRKAIRLSQGSRRATSCASRLDHRGRSSS